MTPRPRVVFAMPAYNRADTLPHTLESLFSQTFRDFALVIVDDAPSPEVQAIVETYAAMHPHTTYEANGVRLGMIGNWRRAFERGRARYPQAEYFAWVSDHDIWHPRWLEVLVGALDENPRVVLAYPQVMRIYPAGRRSVTDLADTAGIAERARRLRCAATGMTAGNAVYGLFRTDALARAGVFRPVVLPDRQLLERLALVGEFLQVPEILWYRSVAGAFSYARQRKMFFPGRPPLYTYLPPNVQHFGLLLWDLGIRGAGRPAFGRLAGVWYAAMQLWCSTVRELLRDEARWRIALRRAGAGRRSPGTQTAAGTRGQ